MAISAQHTRFVTSDYISPMPAEDLIKVALKKQEMYDEGRQKIKQDVTKLQQLRSTIVNEDAQKYFDQEMGKFVKNINQNAGLDFANINNVEAVINLGKPIENDKYIRIALDNGVEAQRIYKELGNVPKDKRSSDNDLVYLKEVQDYVQKGGLDTKLSKGRTYEQFVDISKKLAEAEKEIPAEVETEYGQGPQGYLKEMQITRKRQADIYNRAMMGMSPEEKRQLQIHAQAEMYRMGDDAAYQVWIGHNKQEKIMAETTRREAIGARAELNSIPVKSRTALQQSQLRSIDNIIESQDAVISATNSYIQSSPDDFDAGEYTELFTKRFITGFSKKLSYETTKTELKEDKVALKRMDHDFNIAEIKTRAREDRTTAQFEFDQENYTVATGVGINALKKVPSLLGKDFILDTAFAPSQQVDQIIEGLEANTNLGKAQRESYIRELRVLQNIYLQYQSKASTSDKVSINRSQGLGQVQTSMDDFLTRPVTDILVSGLTLDVLQFIPKAAKAKSDESATAKAQRMLEEEIAIVREVNPGITQDSVNVVARENINRKRSGSGN